MVPFVNRDTVDIHTITICSIDRYRISCYNKSRWGSFVLTGFFVFISDSFPSARVTRKAKRLAPFAFGDKIPLPCAAKLTYL